MFTMGSPLQEAKREPGERQHQVALSRTFWLGAFEVTQAQRKAVIGNNPSHFRERGESLPVEEVTWFEVHDFLERFVVQFYRVCIDQWPDMVVLIERISNAQLPVSANDRVFYLVVNAFVDNESAC